jgi:hypothetical protein
MVHLSRKARTIHGCGRARTPVGALLTPPHMVSRDRRLVARVPTVTLALREDRPCQQRAVDPGRPRPLVCYCEP